MEWDLGLRGIALLLGMSLGAAVVAQLLAWRSMPHHLWIALTAAYAVIGALVSEWWFGWADEEELQPNVDGLSRDEVLLAMFVCVALTVGLARSRAKHRQTPPMGSPHPT